MKLKRSKSGDQWFIIEHTIRRHNILKVFYSREKALEYLKEVEHEDVPSGN